MKQNYIALLLMAMALMGCSGDNEAGGDMSCPTIQASLAVAENQARVTVGEPETISGKIYSKVYWDKQDAFRALDAEGHATITYTLQGEGGSPTGIFAAAEPSTGTILGGVYPSYCVAGNAVVSSSKLPVNLPVEYTLNDNPQNAVMYGAKEGEGIRFYHTMGMMKMVFKRLPAEYKYIKVSSDRYIAGEAKLAVNAASSKVEGGNSKEVVIHRHEGQMVFYCPLPTSSYYKAIYIEKSTDGVKYERARYLGKHADAKGILIEKKMYTVDCGWELTDGEGQTDDLYNENELWN